MLIALDVVVRDRDLPVIATNPLSVFTSSNPGPFTSGEHESRLAEKVFFIIHHKTDVNAHTWMRESANSYCFLKLYQFMFMCFPCSFYLTHVPDK